MYGQSVPWHAMYAQAIQSVAVYGSPVVVNSVNGTKTRECAPFGMSSLPGHRFLTCPGRKLNYAFAISEFISILMAYNRVEFLDPYNPHLKASSDNGTRYHGHYGERLRRGAGCDGSGDQLKYVVETLKKDANSRRAVCVIWNAEYDAIEFTKDYPCNTQLMFLIRDGQLHLTVIRRSSDLVWGVPYDHVVFSLLRDVLAAELGVAPGLLVEFANSLHFYEAHSEAYDKHLNALLHYKSYFGSVDDGHPMLNLAKTESLLSDWLDVEARLFRHDETDLGGYAELADSFRQQDGWWGNAVDLLMGFWLHKRRQKDKVKELYERTDRRWQPLWLESYGRSLS